MLDKMERKLGKYAIPGLMNYIIGGYIIGYVFMFMFRGILSLMTLEPYLIIHGFQFWRVISWVLIPPSNFGLFTIIMLFFYWQLGRSLEQMWGTFKFNLYILGGIFLTVVGAFIYYAVLYFVNGIELSGMGAYFSTYYINMSIFLAFAMTIPDTQIYLYFIIPVKMKWLAIIYAALVGISFVTASSITERVTIVCSLLNFIIFFLGTKKSIQRSYNRTGGRGSRRGFTGGRWGGGNDPRRGWGDGESKWSERQTNTNTNARPVNISRHKCAVCGRTEITNPELEFRFCSKCNGNYEYCSDHLFNHSHVE